MVQLKNDGNFMGIVAIGATSNVIGRPIRSVFSHRGSEAFRSNFNWLCVPLKHRCRNHVPLNIMWTPMRVNGDIIHFVSLLRKH